MTRIGDSDLSVNLTPVRSKDQDKIGKEDQSNLAPILVQESEEDDLVKDFIALKKEGIQFTTEEQDWADDFIDKVLNHAHQPDVSDLEMISGIMDKVVSRLKGTDRYSQHEQINEVDLDLLSEDIDPNEVPLLPENDNLNQDTELEISQELQACFEEVESLAKGGKVASDDIDELSKILAQVAEGKDQDVVVKQFNAKRAHLLSTHKDTNVRLSLAKDPATDLKTLLFLAQDPDEKVRKYLADDPRLGIARIMVRAKINADPQEKTALIARNKDVMNFLANSTLLNDEEKKLLKHMQPRQWLDGKVRYNKLSEEQQKTLQGLIEKFVPDSQPDVVSKKQTLEKLKGALPKWLKAGVDVDMSCLTLEGKQQEVKSTITSIKEFLGVKKKGPLTLKEKMAPMIEQVRERMKKDKDLGYAVAFMKKSDAIDAIKQGVKASLDNLVVGKPPKGMSSSFKLTKEQADKLKQKFADNDDAINDIAAALYDAMVKHVSPKATQENQDVSVSGEMRLARRPTSVTINGVEYKLKPNDKPLGGGTNGTVWLLTSAKGDKVVVKTLNRGKDENKVLDEAEAHRYAVGRDDLQHPNVGKFIGVAHADPPPPVLIQEYIPGREFGDVQDRINEDTKLDPSEKRLANKYLMKQVIKGMAHVQEDRHMMHRDLKPENIRVDSRTLEAKIVDFGEGTTEDRDGEIKGSLAYVAPEMAKGHHDHRADTWSLGAMLYENALGKRFFFEVVEKAGSPDLTDPDLTGEDILAFMASDKFRQAAAEVLDDVKDPELRELLKAMLNPDPDLRPKLSDVLEHPFFAMSKDEQGEAKEIIKKKL